jgi:hypothetical protein
MKSLLLGSGNSTQKKMVHALTPDESFTDLTTLDLQGRSLI